MVVSNGGSGLSAGSSRVPMVHVGEPCCTFSDLQSNARLERLAYRVQTCIRYRADNRVDGMSCGDPMTYETLKCYFKILSPEEFLILVDYSVGRRLFWFERSSSMPWLQWSVACVPRGKLRSHRRHVGDELRRKTMRY